MTEMEEIVAPKPEDLKKAKQMEIKMERNAPWAWKEKAPKPSTASKGRAGSRSVEEYIAMGFRSSAYGSAFDRLHHGVR